MCLLIFSILVENGSEIALAPCTLHRDMAALKCLYLQKYNECDYSQCLNVLFVIMFSFDQI